MLSRKGRPIALSTSFVIPLSPLSSGWLEAVWYGVIPFLFQQVVAVCHLRPTPCQTNTDTANIDMTHPAVIVTDSALFHSKMIKACDKRLRLKVKRAAGCLLLEECLWACIFGQHLQAYLRDASISGVNYLSCLCCVKEMPDLCLTVTVFDFFILNFFCSVSSCESVLRVAALCQTLPHRFAVMSPILSLVPLFLSEPILCSSSCVSTGCPLFFPDVTARTAARTHSHRHMMLLTHAKKGLSKNRFMGRKHVHI